MNLLKRTHTVFAAVALLFIINLSCDDQVNQKDIGTVSFSFMDVVPSGSRTKQDAKSILPSVKTAVVRLFKTKKLELFDFNGEILSQPLALEIGNYTLTEFIVLNANNEVIYIAPIEDSELAYLVEKPLPIDFIITKDLVTKVNPEVVSASGYTAAQFGYVSFSFDIVDTQSFLAGVFIYDASTQSLILTSHKLLIKSGSDTLFIGTQRSATNRITIRTSVSNYSMEFSKSGYTTHSINLTQAELESYQTNPLTIVLTNISLSNGLVAHYPFNGNANDVSNNNLNGVLNGPVLTTDRHNLSNKAYYFDGVNDNITIANNSMLNFATNQNFTISVWVKAEANQAVPSDIIHDIIRKWNGDAQGYPFSLSYINSTDVNGNADKFYAARYDGQACTHAPQQASNLVDNSKFEHLIYMKEGATLKIYVNKQLASTVTDNTSCSTANTSDITIGSRGNLVRYFKGKIDDIRFYNRALTTAEIDELFSL